MLFLLGLSKDAVVRLSQSIRKEKRGTGAIWDNYNFTARSNSVCMYVCCMKLYIHPMMHMRKKYWFAVSVNSGGIVEQNTVEMSFQ